jgi:hypothetical protein
MLEWLSVAILDRSTIGDRSSILQWTRTHTQRANCGYRYRPPARALRACTLAALALGRGRWLLRTR